MRGEPEDFARDLYEAGLRLELPQEAIASAILYYGEAAARTGEAAWVPEHLAAASLFLASKSCESTRRVRDVLSALHHARHGSAAAVLPLDDSYFQTKADVIDAEQRLLCARAAPR